MEEKIIFEDDPEDQDNEELIELFEEFNNNLKTIDTDAWVPGPFRAISNVGEYSSDNLSIFSNRFLKFLCFRYRQLSVEEYFSCTEWFLIAQKNTMDKYFSGKGY